MCEPRLTKFLVLSKRRSVVQNVVNSGTHIRRYPSRLKVDASSKSTEPTAYNLDLLVKIQVGGRDGGDLCTARKARGTRITPITPTYESNAQRGELEKPQTDNPSVSKVPLEVVVSLLGIDM